MSQPNQSKIVQLGDETKVACPTCGVLVVDEDGVTPQPSCQHVRFIYCNGEVFEYIEPDLQKELSKAETPFDESDDFDTWKWLEQNSPKGTVILQQGSSGIACGPTSFTVWFGFNTSDRKPPKPKGGTSKA